MKEPDATGPRRTLERTGIDGAALWPLAGNDLSPPETGGGSRIGMGIVPVEAVRGEPA
jgi:hypothetical protein